MREAQLEAGEAIYAAIARQVPEAEKIMDVGARASVLSTLARAYSLVRHGQAAEK